MRSVARAASAAAMVAFSVGAITIGGALAGYDRAEAATACTSLSEPARTLALNAFDPSAGCEVGSQNNDNNPPSTVNGDNFFNFDDWDFIAKDNFAGNDGPPNGTDEGDATALTLSGTGFSGTFSIAQFIFDTYSDVMLVVKGGAGNNVNPNFIGHLIEVTGGDYDTPFRNENNANLKGISHISLYARGQSTPNVIPLPAPALLLLGGIGAFGLIRRQQARN